MFNKIRAGLYRSLMLIAAIFTVAMIVPSIIIFSTTLYQSYEDMAISKIDRSITDCRSFVNSVMTSTDNLAANTTVKQTLNGENITNSLTEILDNACNYSIKINAITVYDLNGNVYTSSGVSGSPELAELKNNAYLAEFFDDEDSQEYISLRTEYLTKIYDNAPYDANQGILSCCKKVYSDSGDLLGYVFSDIFSSALFNYFNYSNDTYFNNSAAIIKYGGGYLASDLYSKYNEKMVNAETSISVTRIAGRMIVPSSRNFYGGTVYVAVPLTAFYQTVAILSVLFVTLGAVVLLLVHVISKKNARKITDKLDELYDKMDTEINF
ncbi:MAG: cache domain-containing protein [Clostridia bacterium]|nr:cache domain-containing protein [Clostridia bacterium]